MYSIAYNKNLFTIEVKLLPNQHYKNLFLSYYLSWKGCNFCLLHFLKLLLFLQDTKPRTVFVVVAV